MLESKFYDLEQGEQKFNDSLKILEDNNKCFFYKSWWLIPNMAIVNRASLDTSDSRRKRYMKEINSVPENIMGYFNKILTSKKIGLYHTCIDTSINTCGDIPSNILVKRDMGVKGGKEKKPYRDPEEEFLERQRYKQEKINASNEHYARVLGLIDD